MAHASAHARSPFTGEDTSTVWGRKDGQLIYVCPTTGALFFDRAQLKSSDYQEYYPYLAGFDDERFTWELGVRRGKYRRQLAQMRRYAPGVSLVDIGAGPGYFCRVATEEGWAARGVEVAAEAITHGRRRYGVQYVALDDIVDESVDAITCHHVLEHVDEPAAFLAMLRRKLKPRGLLVVHVPHQQPLTFLARDTAARLARADAERFCSMYGDIHISGFTVASLEKVAIGAGFDAHFVRSAGMWSMYYDPFFVRNYVRAGQWSTLARKAVRHAIETVGLPIGLGDWVVGYFAKR